jgi:hypothetical protein
MAVARAHGAVQPARGDRGADAAGRHAHADAAADAIAAVVPGDQPGRR